MMPPEDGAAKVRGPPPFATLEKSELVHGLYVKR